MQTDVYKRMTELCEKIRLEKDAKKFLHLVAELNRLLDEGNIDQKLPPKKVPTISTAA